ncbi:MAG: DUF2911 domain-containing protein [Pyrinomonadaceae bacterium]|nr:DUF2911 domain-containing protein [Pyrinomonadaceae bacterium]
MKYTIFLLLVAFVFVGGLETANAQETKVRFSSIQKSPTDISYMRDGRRGPVHAKVVYSRPYKKDRTIFGELVPFGKVWRTGADEATEITFYKDVMFGGTEVKAGSYALFTIPNKDSWDVILNSGLHQWGAFTYNSDLDVARTKATPQMMDETLENFSIAFSGGNMILAWDKTMVAVPVKVK